MKILRPNNFVNLLWGANSRYFIRASSYNLENIPVPDIYNLTAVFHKIYSFHQPQQLHRTKLRKSQIVITLSERKLQNDEEKTRGDV